jgi:hypothetical protein
MANRTLLGVFPDVQTAVGGVDALLEAGFSNRDYDVLTDTPYPEDAFGEHTAPHKLFAFPFIGAFCGLSMALLVTIGTQISYPMITGGKPLLSIPPMINVMYEGTMLGAILFTIIGIIFESRLPNLGPAPYDPRITEGYLGVLVTRTDGMASAAERAMRDAGAIDIVGQPAATGTSSP